MSVGSVVALFQIGTSSNAIAQAVSTLVSNPNAIPNLPTSSVNINGRSYFAQSAAVGETSTSSGRGSTSDAAVWTNTGLIIGLVVGLVLATLVVVSVIVGHRVHKKKSARSQCMVEPGNDVRLSVINRNDPASPRPSVDMTKEVMDANVTTLVEVFTSPSMDQLDSESTANRGHRQGSAFSLRTIGSAATTTERPTNPGLHTLKLIDFD